MSDERLREVIIDLKRALEKEREGRRETEAILQCMNSVHSAKDSNIALKMILETLAGIVGNDEGMILLTTTNPAKVLSATSPFLSLITWNYKDLPARVFDGKLVRLYDLSRSQSFSALPPDRGLMSAVCFPIQTSELSTILVLFSSQTGFFGLEHGRLFKRLIPLMEQALNSIEIEQLRRVTEAANARARVAAASNRAKSEFVANMSHELRTPLNGIFGNVELAILECQDKIQHKHLELALESADSLLQLVNDIIDLSRLEARTLNLEPIDFEIRPAIEKTVNIFLAEASKRNLDIKLEIDPAIPETGHGDRRRLCQVLQNLTGNALKFTEKGSVSVVLRYKPLDRSQYILHFIVEDTGVGIPEDSLSKIFERFWQVDGTTTRKHDGSGIGLAITRNILVAMGGSIQVESEVGRGSRFEFEIPLQAVEDYPTRPSTAQPAVADTTDTPVSGFRVLLAEDNPVNQKIATRLLQKMGHDVQVVPNGREAVDKVLQCQYDLVLMDVHMPVLDGLDATKEIRKRCNSGNSPVIIALTASAMIGDREKCLDVGMNDYLAKPIRYKTLKAVIEKNISGQTLSTV